MSDRLKLALLIHLIVSVVVGALLFVVPGRSLAGLGWAPIDPILSRILGAALLAMAWGDLRVRRRGTRAEARLWVEVHLGFSALAAIGVLRHLLVGHWPAMPWIVFAILGLFALMWLGALTRETR